MIIIYTRPNCAYCPMVEKLAHRYGVTFRRKLAEGDKYEAMAKRFGGYTVPLTYNPKNDKGFVGWNISELKNVMGVK